MTYRRKLFLLIALLILAFIAIITISLAKGSQAQPSKGTVQITYGIPSTTGLTVKFNNHSMSPKSMYSLSPNKYTLSITGTGYKPFATTFFLSKNQTILINAALQLTTIPNITSTQQLTVYGESVPQLTITDVTYFYQQTWAVLMTENTVAQYIIVAQYLPSSQSWNIVLGPGSSFTQSSLSKVPPLVSSYMTTNNYVDLGV
ncbi:MAG TPA: hypothetical protein VMB52_01155 [Verrucomicrobiae bacterium]|nr:hypothetical protein [Verrucomicrobiae bacterium]